MNIGLQTPVKPEPTIYPAAAKQLHRMCSRCDILGMESRQVEEKTKKQVLNRSSANKPELTNAPPIVHDVLRSPGKPLDNEVRRFMEPRFGHDFSRVRVHTDEKAVESARAVNALAYTVGRDVVFGAGQFAPGTEATRKLLAHELTHVVQQERQNNLQLQRYSIDGSCSSPEKFPAEQRGNMQCQDGTTVPNGTVYQLSFASLPNRCPKDNYERHSPDLIEQAVKKAISRISSERPAHCLEEEEFRRGVLDTLNDITIQCDKDRSGPPHALVVSNTMHLTHGSIHGNDDDAIEHLSSLIFHEALHNWEGRIIGEHTGIVTPCTAACFPRSGQAMVNTNPLDCVMPPLVRGSSVSAGLQGEATRGGGMGITLSYRRSLFTALHGHLAGKLGMDISYEYLFSPDAQMRYGSELVKLAPAAGLEFRPGVTDRKGLIFNLDVAPQVEIGSTGVRPGFRFDMGTGLEFDFLYVGAGVGMVIPLSSGSEKTLDISLRTGISF
ncbi:MAG: DUF4157 domain-containing protein [Candidatus Methanoperedens sp.]|nr:DUF4157 domain-containing protein [Candidatus Methanoperedens sp.]